MAYYGLLEQNCVKEQCLFEKEPHVWAGYTARETRMYSFTSSKYDLKVSAGPKGYCVCIILIGNQLVDTLVFKVLLLLVVLRMLGVPFPSCFDTQV